VTIDESIWDASIAECTAIKRKWNSELLKTSDAEEEAKNDKD
jgi:hypothetical protein